MNKLEVKHEGLEERIKEQEEIVNEALKAFRQADIESSRAWRAADNAKRTLEKEEEKLRELMKQNG